MWKLYAPRFSSLQTVRHAWDQYFHPAESVELLHNSSSLIIASVHLPRLLPFHSNGEWKFSHSHSLYQKYRVKDKLWKLDWFDPEATGIRSMTSYDRSLCLGFHRLRITQRVFLAILAGTMPFDTVHCQASICRTEGDSIFKLARKIDQGFPCYSMFYPLQHSFYEGRAVTLCEILDLTGRPFQCRLHAVSLGYPIVGDNVSKFPELDSFIDDRRIDAPRTMLHCWKARFYEPDGKSKWKKVEVEAPEALTRLLHPRQQSKNMSLPLDTRQAQSFEVCLDGTKRENPVPHMGFFHFVDSTNISSSQLERLPTMRIPQTSEFLRQCPISKNETNMLEHDSTFCEAENFIDEACPQFVNSFSESTEYALSLSSMSPTVIEELQIEERLHFIQNVYQKFHDNCTPWD
ncbi:hypothetical protein IE077_000177 [Cardiosporidium cionae]|uniref:Uncharacterized protein n=1 Tax=Cardiosporidium cionae TaxID=476202 RepID=A0ABQ7JD26_9APIC|nr:hypothetical protein IE077_000177 [Cardiosporidium cionae]|eukprot:KAF8821820.1 hypothetical protein IE077_000177 [Cardiosporidium cionae]